MPEHQSKSRKQAEMAFAQVQSEFLARDRPGVVIDPAAQERAEKTQRLKAARLARAKDTLAQEQPPEA